MHAVVEIIPLLLHSSLILFFAGLVAFLWPVNTAMTAVAAGILLVIISVYGYLTVLPILHSDSPYRTPLSGLLRYTYREISKTPLPFFRQPKGLDEESGSGDSASTNTDVHTLVEVMTKHATYLSPERDARDSRALIWTMRSLTDDDELEPFVEAIPGVLWGNTERRHLYDGQIQALLYHSHPDVQLLPRVVKLLRGCDSGLLPDSLRHRRQILCLKAIWAIAHLDVKYNEPFLGLDLDALRVLPLDSWDPTVQPYLLSVLALSQARLARWFQTPGRRTSRVISKTFLSHLEHGVSVIQVMLGYLQNAAYLRFPPYQFFPTCEEMTRNAAGVSQQDIEHINSAFGLIMDNNVARLKLHAAIHHIDSIV